jgi:hypothetical protein
MALLADIIARTQARKAKGIAIGQSHGTKRIVLPVAPCAHRGDSLTGLERDALGLDHRRGWYWCQHAAQPLGAAVCGCRGCGRTCPGFSPEPES